MTSGAFALDIQVSPQMLVLSSIGGQLTVHTDVPFATAQTVVLEVNGTAIAANTFADNCGNLVAQCSKEAVKEVIDTTTTATISLTVNGDSDSEVIRVKE
jgi:hypothetical protein